jgi:hypothetical protein
MSLTRMQKSMAVREWNRGKHTLQSLAAFVGNCGSRDLEAYLKTRKGYPGKILPRQPMNAMPEGKPRHTGAGRKATPQEPIEREKGPKVEQYNSRKPVTLVKMPWDENGATA